MKLFITAAVALLNFVVVLPADAMVAGWEQSKTDYLGSHQGECLPDQTKGDIVLKDYNNQTADPTGIRMKTQVVQRSDGGAWQMVRETGYVTGVTLSNPVCYSPATESIRVVVEAGSNAKYESFNGAAWWSSKLSQRLAQRGQYLRGEVYLKAKSGQPTADLLEPAQVFLRTQTPRFIVKTNDVALLHGATGMSRSFFGFWQNNRRVARIERGHGGQTGTREFTLGNFPDGLYTWSVVQQLNGAAKVRGDSSLTIRLIPGTGISDIKQFVIDTVPPTASVTVTAATSSETGEVQISTAAQDTVSGLRQITVVFEPIGATNARVATVTVPFAVGTGLTGGPKDRQVVRWRSTLVPNVTYRYRAVAVDVAGNVFTTPTQTFVNATVLRLTPDISDMTIGIGQRLTEIPFVMSNVGSAIIRDYQYWITIGSAQFASSTRTTNLTPTSREAVTAAGSFTGPSTPTTLPVRLCARASTSTESCDTARLTVITPQCSDGRDNDNDNQVDAADSGCYRDPLDPSTYDPSDLYENDLAVLTPPVITLAGRPDIVPFDTSATLDYSVAATYPITCTLSGGGESQTVIHLPPRTEGSFTTKPLQGTITFTLSCLPNLPGITGTPTSVTETIEVTPRAQEV
jgi:hypothetical protein